jgi:hypothetical protein
VESPKAPPSFAPNAVILRNSAGGVAKRASEPRTQSVQLLAQQDAREANGFRELRSLAVSRAFQRPKRRGSLSK